MKALVILLALVATAHAEPARNTISILPRAFLSTGIAVEGERTIPARKLSVAIAINARSTAGGDYDSATLGLGGELRWWFRRHWYAAARVDVDRTSLSMDGASLGAMRTLSFGVRAGFRWNPWRALEVRPFVGIAVRTDAGGGLPAWRRGGFDYGLALGWSF